MSVDIRKSLQWDPFVDDFGSPGDRALSDKIVKARKNYMCCWCRKTTQIGEITRSRIAVVDGEIHSHRYCNACITLMAVAVDYADFDAHEQAETELKARMKEGKENEL